MRASGDDAYNEYISSELRYFSDVSKFIFLIFYYLFVGGDSVKY